MLEELSATQRIAWRAMSAIAVIASLYVPGASFFTANRKTFASDLGSMSNAQRCADHISFFFNDKKGKNIDPANFESLVIVNDNPAPVYKRNSERKGMKGFVTPTQCGINQMNVKISYQNRTMELIIKRIPGDQGDIYIYSIPFSKGTYMFDFEDDLDKSCEDNVKGYHGECTISPKRFKKITPESSKQGRAE